LDQRTASLCLTLSGPDPAPNNLDDYKCISVIPYFEEQISILLKLSNKIVA
jgi:hypothetical protein